MRTFVLGILSLTLALTITPPVNSYSRDGMAIASKTEKVSKEDQDYLDKVQVVFSTLTADAKAFRTHGGAEARSLSTKFAVAANKCNNERDRELLLKAAYLLELKSGPFDAATLTTLQKLTDELMTRDNPRVASALWKQAVTFVDDRKRAPELVDRSITASNFMDVLKKCGDRMDAADRQKISEGKVVKSIDRIELEERIQRLEKATSKDTVELCDARLKMARWYFNDGNHDEGSKLLNLALKQLSKDGPVALDSNMARDLMLVMENLLPMSDNTTSLVERSYCLLEEKADGGVTDAQLFPLTHQKAEKGSVQAARAISLLHKLIAIREKREDPNSVKLEPLLYALNSVQQRNGEYEEPIVNQQKIIRLLQSENGLGSDREIIETAQLAWLCIKAQKFDEAKTYCDSTVALALRRQSSPILKSSVADQLGEISKAYSEAGKTTESDDMLRQGIELSDVTSAPGANHFSLAGAIDALVKKYLDMAQPGNASALLQFVIDKQNFGAEGISTNAWRYQLAQIYLEESNNAGSGADELRAKSKKIFDQAQEVSKKNTAMTTPRVTAFIQQRRDTLQKYGMTNEASALQNQ